LYITDLVLRFNMTNVMELFAINFHNVQLLYLISYYAIESRYHIKFHRMLIIYCHLEDLIREYLYYYAYILAFYYCI